MTGKDVRRLATETSPTRHARHLRSTLWEVHISANPLTSRVTGLARVWPWLRQGFERCRHARSYHAICCFPPHCSSALLAPVNPPPDPLHHPPAPTTRPTPHDKNCQGVENDQTTRILHLKNYILRSEKSFKNTASCPCAPCCINRSERLPGAVSMLRLQNECIGGSALAALVLLWPGSPAATTAWVRLTGGNPVHRGARKYRAVTTEAPFSTWHPPTLPWSATCAHGPAAHVGCTQARRVLLVLVLLSSCTTRGSSNRPRQAFYSARPSPALPSAYPQQPRPPFFAHH